MTPSVILSLHHPYPFISIPAYVAMCTKLSLSLIHRLSRSSHSNMGRSSCSVRRPFTAGHSAAHHYQMYYHLHGKHSKYEGVLQ